MRPRVAALSPTAVASSPVTKTAASTSSRSKRISPHPATNNPGASPATLYAHPTEPHQIGCFPEIPRRQWPDVQQPPLLSASWALFVKLGTAVPTHNVTECYAKFFPIFHPHARGWPAPRPS